MVPYFQLRTYNNSLNYLSIHHSNISIWQSIKAPISINHRGHGNWEAISQKVVPQLGGHDINIHIINHFSPFGD